MGVAGSDKDEREGGGGGDEGMSRSNPLRVSDRKARNAYYDAGPLGWIVWAFDVASNIVVSLFTATFGVAFRVLWRVL
jgi:hypothetical protein